MPRLPSVAGRCMTVPYHAPDLTRLEADAAAAVADQRHLLAVERLLGAGRALVGADDQVDVRCAWSIVCAALSATDGV